MAVATKPAKRVGTVKKATLPTSSSKVRGQVLGTIDAVKAALKKGGGGGQFIKKIPKDDILTVRFLTNPEEWFGYYEVYDPALGYSKPQVEGAQVEANQNVSFRFLTNALDVVNDRVIPLQLPKDLASRLFAKYEKTDDLTDRDYDLSRSGEGLGTVYDYDPGDRSKINISKYELLDLGEVLEAAVADGQISSKPASKASKARAEVADDEEDEAPVAKKATPKAKLRKIAEPEPEPELDEEEEDEEIEEPDEEDIELEEEEDDEEEDEDDDVDTPTVADDSDEEDDEFLTEQDLNNMTLGALRKLADEYDVDSTGKSKAKLIQSILDSGEE